MKRHGGCNCGGVRYSVSGEPLRVGLCHCQTCRRESGSSFTTYAVWPRDAFSTTGETREWGGRSFCPVCGARVFCLREEEAEIRLGSLDDAPNYLVPSVEGWTIRREPWLCQLPDAGQFSGDPT